MQKGNITIGVIIAVAVLAFGGSFLAYKNSDLLGTTALRVLNVEQGGTGTGVAPALDEILIGDGTGEYTFINKALIGGGGSSKWTDNTTYLTPLDATQGISIQASSTISALNTNSLLFNTTTVATTSRAGLLQWNATEDTLDIGMSNGTVMQQVGQENFIYVKNQTGGTLTNGKPVMYSGAVGVSGRIKAQYAIADGTLPSSYILGITTQDITNGNDGFVTSFGKVRGIDTTGATYGETWADGDLLYVSATTPGALTNVAPSAPNYQIAVASVVTAHAVTGTIFVRSAYTSKLVDLADVNGTALTTSGQIPVWDAINQYFDFTQNINNKQNLISTSTLSVNGSLLSSGTLGAQVGGTNSQLSINMGNANSWTALQTFANSSTTGVATVNELCFSTGECMNAPTVEGSGLTLYPWNVVTDVATYEGLRTLPQGIAEVDESCTATAGYCTSPIDNYVSTTTLSASGPLVLTKIPSGTWVFDVYGYVSNAVGNSYIEMTMYKRSSLGVETFLFQATTTAIDYLTPGLTQITSTQPEFAFGTTDRLVARVKAYTDSGAPVTIHWVYNNGAHYSHITTPITVASEAIAFLPADNVFTGFNTFNTFTALSGTTTNASSTNLYSTNAIISSLLTTNATSTAFKTTTLGVGTDYLTDITGSGLNITTNALTCITSNSTTFGCLTAADWNVFNNKLASTSIDTSSELATILTDETGTAGNLVFSTNPLFAGLRSSASSTIDALTVRISTTTSATSTTLSVTGTFNFLGTVITNIATWFSTTLNAVSAFVAAPSSTWDFGDAALFEIPNGTGPTANDVGEIAHDSTDNQLIMDDYVIRTKQEIFNFAIPSTSPAFASGTVKYLPLKEDGYVVTDLACFVEGGTSKAITLFGEAITCGTTSTTDDGTISIPTIASASTTAGGGVTAGATTGVVNWLNVTITGVYTRE